jgi:K+-sensing histidine kinase KdpD
MPWKVKAVTYAVTLVMGLVAGWMTNGWRLEARISDLKASYLKDYAEAEKQARQKEQELSAKADLIRKQKNEQIANINSQLRAALNGLRDRPSSINLPADTTPGQTAQGCYPAELYREHAEMALREAARADTIRSALNACYLQYDSLRP